MINRIAINQYKQSLYKSTTKSDIIWYYSGLLNTPIQLSEVDRLEVWI